jgi:hypothetical protein
MVGWIMKNRNDVTRAHQKKSCQGHIRMAMPATDTLYRSDEKSKGGGWWVS